MWLFETSPNSENWEMRSCPASLDWLECPSFLTTGGYFLQGSLLSWLAVMDGEPLLWELRMLCRPLSQEPAGLSGVFVCVQLMWVCVRARACAHVRTDTWRDHALSRGTLSPQGGEIGS